MAKSKFATKINNKRIAAHQATYAEKDAYGDDIHAALANKADKSEIPDGVPAIASGDEGKVLKVEHGSAVWGESGGGGGGGLSPITPTILTPVVENETYKITIPDNNAYYMVTLSEGYNVEIEPPTLNEGELFNIILLIETTDGSNKTMTIPDYYDRGILPMTEQTQWGSVYGIGWTQFVFLGKGYTMTTSAYFSG